MYNILNPNIAAVQHQLYSTLQQHTANRVQLCKQAGNTGLRLVTLCNSTSQSSHAHTQLNLCDAWDITWKPQWHWKAILLAAIFLAVFDSTLT